MRPKNLMDYSRYPKETEISYHIINDECKEFLKSNESRHGQALCGAHIIQQIKGFTFLYNVVGVREFYPIMWYFARITAQTREH